MRHSHLVHKTARYRLHSPVWFGTASPPWLGRLQLRELRLHEAARPPSPGFGISCKQGTLHPEEAKQRDIHISVQRTVTGYISQFGSAHFPSLVGQIATEVITTT